VQHETFLHRIGIPVKLLDCNAWYADGTFPPIARAARVVHVRHLQDLAGLANRGAPPAESENWKWPT
jgi:hypothetical protein